MGFEPTTLCLASIRSSQLSYTRNDCNSLLQSHTFVNLLVSAVLALRASSRKNCT